VSLDYLIKTATPTPNAVEYPVLLKRLRVNGNKGGGANCGGVYVSSFQAVLEELYIAGCTGTGLKTENAVTNAAGDIRCEYVYAYDCDVGCEFKSSDIYLDTIIAGSCSTEGVRIETTHAIADKIHAYGCGKGLVLAGGKFYKLSNVQLSGNDIGLYTEGTFNSDILINNINFWDNSQYHIHHYGTNTAWAGRLTLNNVMFVYEATRPDRAIRMEYPARPCFFTNVNTRGTPYVTAMFQILNPQSVFRIYYDGVEEAKPLSNLARNRGTITIPSGQTSGSAPHRLAGTPTIVVLGPTHDEVADAVWSADATNITVTVPSAVSADREVSWYAEYIA